MEREYYECDGIADNEQFQKAQDRLTQDDPDRPSVIYIIASDCPEEVRSTIKAIAEPAESTDS